MIYKIKPGKRNRYFSLFKNNKYDLVLMASVLEGKTGSMWVDDIENPRVARLDTGLFTVFAGDCTAKKTLDLVRQAPIHFVTPENESWKNILCNEFQGRISSLHFSEYSLFSKDETLLKEMIDKLPKNYKLKPLDKSLCMHLGSDIGNKYFLENFSSIDDFLDLGIGFCVLLNNQIVSAATSMAAAGNMIDIEIETVKEYRKKGLGTIVAAKLVLSCIKKEITPKWMAANRESEK
ncbi:MAG: GNAT family N-acetyltransferase, partial [Actinomycetota bacterium]|nr:GNAT family N-acetyltransferase [Actinomycetota bacterium]